MAPKEITTITCPHCGKIIEELKYTEHGHMRISDHSEGGGDMDFPDRAYHCPECDEEIEYEDLEKAGVF